MSKPKKANFFVKSLKNIEPASSTFTFESQAVFHPAGVVTTVFIVSGKVTVKIGDGRDAGIKIDKKGQNIPFIQFYLEHPLSLKLKYVLSLDASKLKKKCMSVLRHRMRLPCFRDKGQTQMVAAF